jgi:hypothetical protein
MCWIIQADLECSEDNCHQIIVYMAYIGDDPCNFVNNNGIGIGECGWSDSWKHGQPVKASKHNLCMDCKAKWVEAGIERYSKMGEHVAASREAGQKRDDQRHLMDVESRSVTPRPQNQNALLYGMPLERGAGPLGYDLGASAMCADRGMGIAALLQKLDLHDFGEEPSDDDGN